MINYRIAGLPRRSGIPPGAGQSYNINVAEVFLILITLLSFRIEAVLALDTLPVELIYFNASVQERWVLLFFGTATEVNNYGFEIERTRTPFSPPLLRREAASDEGGWGKIGFVAGHGTSYSPKDYVFEDTSITANGTYHYRLKQIDNDGKFKFSDSIEVNVDFITSLKTENIVQPAFRLYQNYPNPFNPSTVLLFEIGSSSFVTLKVFDLSGNEICVLINDEKPAGQYAISFDSKTLPHKLTSGIYFYQLTAGKFSAVKKMVLLR